MMKKYKNFIIKETDVYSDIDGEIILPDFYDETGKKAYKGIYNFDFNYIHNISIMKIDPLSTIRKSKGSLSGFIEFIGIKRYGNREHSVIGTSSKYYAKNWGNYTYEIIPEVDEIYICPNEDFNQVETWSYFFSKFDRFTFYIYDFMLEMAHFYKFLYGEKIKDERDGELIKDFIEKDFNKIKNIDVTEDEFIKKLSINKYYGVEPIKYAYKFIKVAKEYNTLDDMFSDLMDPVKNGFEKIKFSDYQKSIKYINNEVWFNCKCILKKI